jgi:hypothetical protein
MVVRYFHFSSVTVSKFRWSASSTREDAQPFPDHDWEQLSIVCQIAHHLHEARPRDRDFDIPFSEMIFKKIGRGHECENKHAEILQIV